MSKEELIISRNLLESILAENERLKSELAEYKSREPITPQVMERQISIEEYTKSLKLKPTNGKKKKN